MLRFPENYRVSVSEFVCSKCDNEFFVPYEPREALTCPFCSGASWNNGHFTVYARNVNEKDETQEVQQG